MLRSFLVVSSIALAGGWSWRKVARMPRIVSPSGPSGSTMAEIPAITGERREGEPDVRQTGPAGRQSVFREEEPRTGRIKLAELATHDRDDVNR